MKNEKNNTVHNQIKIPHSQYFTGLTAVVASLSGSIASDTYTHAHKKKAFSLYAMRSF